MLSKDEFDTIAEIEKFENHFIQSIQEKNVLMLFKFYRCDIIQIIVCQGEKIE